MIELKNRYIVLENRGYREPLQGEFKRDFEFMRKTVGGEKFALSKNIGLEVGL